jgi:hypothetical protein
VAMGHQARRNDLIGRIILSSFVLLVSRTGLIARPHRSRYVLQQSPVTRPLETTEPSPTAPSKYVSVFMNQPT